MSKQIKQHDSEVKNDITLVCSGLLLKKFISVSLSMFFVHILIQLNTITIFIKSIQAKTILPSFLFIKPLANSTKRHPDCQTQLNHNCIPFARIIYWMTTMYSYRL